MDEIESEFGKIAANIAKIEGHLMEGQDKFLYALARCLPDDATILEIGSFKGKSTVSMGYACKGTGKKIYCIDTFNGNDSDFNDRDFFSEWRRAIAENGLEDYVTPLPGFSAQVLADWNEITHNKKVDLAFIDGSHQFLDVLNDFYGVYPVLKNGGICAFHDVVPQWPGPYKVWHEIAGSVLEDHVSYLSLACGRKYKELPRWVDLYIKKLLAA